MVGNLLPACDCYITLFVLYSSPRQNPGLAHASRAALHRCAVRASTPNVPYTVLSVLTHELRTYIPCYRVRYGRESLPSDECVGCESRVYEPNDCTHMHGHHEADYFMDMQGLAGTSVVTESRDTCAGG